MRTASSVKAASISSENLISEVVMARILMERSASALKAWAATPAWLRMPMPMTEILATSVAPSSRRITDRLFCLGEDIERALIVRRRHGEGEVGVLAVGRDVLHDHVDIDIAFGERAENGRRHAGLVLDLADRYLRLVPGEGDAGDGLLLHDLVLLDRGVKVVGA